MSPMTTGAASCSKWPGVTMWFIHSASSGNLSARSTPRTISNQCSVVAGGGTASEEGTAGAGPAAGVASEQSHSSKTPGAMRRQPASRKGPGVSVRA